MTKLEELKEYIRKMDYYDRATTLFYWDMDTATPELGFDGHNEANAFFATEGFKMSTSPELKAILDALAEPEEFDLLDDNWKFIVRKMIRDYEENARVPVDFYNEYVRVRTESEHVWEDAKRNSDYASFAPYLKKVIEMTKQYAEYVKPGVETYDALVDMYEEGMDTATIDRVFDELKAELIPLVQKVADRPGSEAERAKFKREYDINEQREVQKLLLSYIGFDWAKGTTGESEHPFTLSFSSKDVRITNHFREQNPVDGFFSAIHEGGHAIFDQNVNPELDGTVAGSCEYMGIHESQSRFYENILARRKSFWLPIYDKIQASIHGFEDISIDEFVREINRVSRSFIRTMADEVTYCLHIILRYELEKKIFREGVDVSELPRLWNEKMQEYLGITPENDAEGILQDMHWGEGALGYFPSYLLGSIYDGMILDAVEADLGNVDRILEEGRILDITHWLNEKIHRFGSTRLPKDVIREVCGKELSAQPLIRYFKSKFED